MIRKTIKGGDFKSQMVGELVFDQVPEEGSFNPVTSDAVVKAIDKAKDDMQEKIDEVTLDPSAVALGNVHLLDEVTEFPADGCILVDSETDGTRKMSKDDLMQNVLSPLSEVVFSTEWNGVTGVTSQKIPVVKGVPVVIRVSNVSWGVSSLPTAAYNKLVITGIKANGDFGARSLYARDSLVPSEIVFTPEDDDLFVTLFVRADVGEDLSFNIVCGIVDTINKNKVLNGTSCGLDKIRVYGNGNNLKACDEFAVIPGATYKIEFDNAQWDVTGVTDPRKLYVRYKDSAGSFANNYIATFVTSETIPSVLYVTFPDNAYGGDVALRATNGVTVSFKVSLHSRSVSNNNVDSNVFSVAPTAMMSGNVTLSTSSAVFNPEYGRHRFGSAIFRDKAFVSAKAGDSISLSDYSNYSYYIAYSSDGNAPYTVKGWLKEKVVFATDCKFTILIKTDDFSYLDYADFAKLLIFNSQTSEIMRATSISSDVYGKIGTIGKTNSKILSFNGAGDTAVIKQFDVPLNSTVKISISKPNWDFTPSSPMNKLCIRYYDDDDVVYGNDYIIYYFTQSVPKEIYFKTPDGRTRWDIFFRADVGESVDFEVSVISEEVYTDRYLFASDATRSNLIKSINHRGYNTTCPENTLPAYRESARQGFHCVETDIQLTADNKWVCIHDSTIDRTSDHTGNVSDYTLEQLKTFDFGSWKSSKFAGTKIPTFEEFICTCKRLGLGCYVELKSGAGYIANACNIVKMYGMDKQVTWISFLGALLYEVRSEIPSARLGVLLNTITQDGIDYAVGLKNSENDVFINAAYTQDNISAGAIELLKANGMPVEYWTVNGIGYIESLDPYASGVTSDILVAANVIFEKELNA